MPEKTKNKASDINHWLNRKNELEKWFNSHEINHPDWDQNIRDFNIAEWKIKELQERKNRKLKDFPETYSIPHKY